MRMFLLLSTSSMGVRMKRPTAKVLIILLKDTAQPKNEFAELTLMTRQPPQMRHVLLPAPGGEQSSRNEQGLEMQSVMAEMMDEGKPCACEDRASTHARQPPSLVFHGVKKVSDFLTTSVGVASLDSRTSTAIIRLSQILGTLESPLLRLEIWIRWASAMIVDWVICRTSRTLRPVLDNCRYESA